MKQATIFLPVIATAAWTLTVLLLIPYHRINAGLGGRLVIA